MPEDTLENSTRLLQKPTIDNRFVYTGERLKYVAFPLGGIGTGSVSLTGSGRLIDWSIRNRPAIHQFNGYTHFAIKAEQDGKLLGARVLNGPYEGSRAVRPVRASSTDSVSAPIAIRWPEFPTLMTSRSSAAFR